MVLGEVIPLTPVDPVVGWAPYGKIGGPLDLSSQILKNCQNRIIEQNARAQLYVADSQSEVELHLRRSCSANILVSTSPVEDNSKQTPTGRSLGPSYETSQTSHLPETGTNISQIRCQWVEIHTSGG